jgi:hypothetical protein
MEEQAMIRWRIGLRSLQASILRFLAEIDKELNAS